MALEWGGSDILVVSGRDYTHLCSWPFVLILQRFFWFLSSVHPSSYFLMGCWFPSGL